MDVLLDRLACAVTGQDTPPAHTTTLCRRVLSSSLGRTRDAAADADTEAAVAAAVAAQLLHRGDARGALRVETLRKRLVGVGRVGAALSLLDELSGTASLPQSAAAAAAAALPRRATGPPPAAGRDPHGYGHGHGHGGDVALGGGDHPASPARRRRGPPSGEALFERELVRDVLFAFQGIDGRHVKYDARTEAYRVDPAAPAGVAQRDLVVSLCELGWLFRRVASRVNRPLTPGADQGGLVEQAFCASFQAELTDYYRLIAVLEAQLGDGDGTGGDGGEGGAAAAPPPQTLTLRRLAMWTFDPLERMRVMAVVADNTAGLRGGALATALHRIARHGDPSTAALVGGTLAAATAPLVRILDRWLRNGELADPHGEFFVVADAAVADADGHALWHAKHRVDPAMLPAFVPADVAAKMLVVGKSIDFARRCCGGAPWTAARGAAEVGGGGADEDALRDALASAAASEPRPLVELVDRASAVTSARLLELLRGPKFNLVGHLAALKKVMLLGQGDFVGVLMDSLMESLSQRAGLMYRHDLTGTVDQALRASNAQYEPQDVLDRVGVRLLEPSAGDLGWNVFTLDYHIDAPLSAVIGTDACETYRRAFHMLWALKRVERLLSLAWQRQATASHVRLARAVPALSAPLHEASLARARMSHLVENLSHYIMFEVLEQSWATLMERVQAAVSLAEVTQAHDDYLAELSTKALMTAAHAPLAGQLRKVLDAAVQFCGAQEALFTDALSEMLRQEAEADAVAERTDAGGWGDDGNAAAGASSRVGGVSPLTLARMEEVSADFTAGVQAFFVELRAVAHRDDHLRFLLFRLDYNHFLSQEEAREQDVAFL